MKQATTTTTTMQRAQWLLSLGCSPLPVAPAQPAPLTKEGKPLFNGKNPSYLDASGKPHLIKHSAYKETQPTPKELAEWFANPSNGIGTLAGQGGIDWIDLDRKNFDSQAACDNARAQILERCDRTYFETTKSGGAHIAIKLKEPKSFTNFELGGKHAGEFLGQGRFVVLAPTPGYESQNGDEIATAQSAESLGLAKVGGAQPTKDMAKPPVGIERLVSKSCKEILAGKADDVSAALAKLARECYGVAEWYPAQGLPVSGDADVLIKQAAEKLNVSSERLERILQPISTTGNLPSLVKYGGPNKAITFFRKQRQAQFSGDEVCAELRKIKDLRRHYEGRVAYNQLSQKIEVDGVTIEDIEGERISYVESANKAVGVDLFCSVLRVIANENAFHPVAKYLEKVSEQHGDDTSILDGIAQRYFGVDDDLYDTYVVRWLVSAVARIFKPGCKADCALFLQGGQGARKSTFFQRLAGADFFSDSLGDTQSNKDEILLMHRFWIHEWSELETVFRKKEMASVKSFMARGFDSVRPPYRRDLVDLKRACVFAGTTNEQSFLSDNTGDRRFWTIPVQGKIPTELLDQERDKIWAAAVALFRAGEQWHLTEDEERRSSELNAQFRSLDPWHEKISSFVSGKQNASTNEILTECFQYELKNIGRKEQLRVSGVLTSLGWCNKAVKENGKVYKRWVAPERVVAERVVAEPVVVAEPEPVVAEPVVAEFVVEPAVVNAGDVVVYFGSKFEALHGLNLKVHKVGAGYVVCTKPNGEFTTNLPTDQIIQASEI